MELKEEKGKPAPGAPGAEMTKTADKPKVPPLDEKAAGNFIGRFMANTKPVEPPPEDKKPDETTAEDKDKKPLEEKPKPKTEKKPKKPVEVAPLTAADLETAVTAGVRTVMEETRKPEVKPKPETPDPDADLPAEHKRTIRILDRMEKNNKDKGDKYNGLSQKYRTFLDDLVAYAEKWEEEHPGKEFNEDDDEHSEFFAKQPDWDDEDYTDAVADIKLDERLGVERQETAKKLSVLEKQEKLRQAIPKIREVKVSHARTFLGEMGDQFKHLLGENGAVDKTVEQKAMEADPITAQIVFNAANTVETYTGDCHALFNNLIDYNAKNQVHVGISNFILQKEQQLLKKPAKDQRDEKGRRFVPAADYWKMSEDERKKCWTFTDTDVNLMMTAAIVKQTKDQITAEEDKFTRRAKARGYSSAGGAPPKPEGKPAEEKPKKPENEEDETPPENDKPDSPSAAPGPRGAGNEPDKTAAGSGITTFTNKFLGKPK